MATCPFFCSQGEEYIGWRNGCAVRPMTTSSSTRIGIRVEEEFESASGATD